MEVGATPLLESLEIIGQTALHTLEQCEGPFEIRITLAISMGWAWRFSTDLVLDALTTEMQATWNSVYLAWNRR